MSVGDSSAASIDEGVWTLLFAGEADFDTVGLGETDLAMASSIVLGGELFLVGMGEADWDGCVAN